MLIENYSEQMQKCFDALPCGFWEWCEIFRPLHKLTPEYQALDKKAQKRYSKIVDLRGYDMDLGLVYLSACVYPNVISKHAILKQIFMTYGNNPKTDELAKLIERMGSDLYQNINGIRDRFCLSK